MGSGNPTSGHTNKNLTVTTATNADGLTDGEHIISPTLTNMIEGIHGNGVVMYDDTSSGEGDRNIPANIPGAVNYASATTFTVKGGYAVLDGTMYQFAGGVGATTTYTLETSSASAAGSPAVVNSGKEALVVVYVCADNTSTVKNIYWEIGGATPIGTSAYPTTPASFLDIPIATGTASENYLSNNQTVVLAVLRVVYAAGSGDLTLAITEVNDKRVFVRPSPMYFSPVTGGDIASTNELLDLDAFHSGVGNGALGASRFGAMWQSFGAAVTGGTVPDDNKDVLYYSGTHAARFTRSVFDRVLTSTATSITLKSTDANILLLTPSGNATVTTSGSFPAGYIIEIRNLHASRTVAFARASSYSIAGGTLTRFVCTTSHATTPVFSVLSDDSIETVQLANDSVTTAKIVDANVTTAKIADDAITSAKIADGAVDTEHIATDAIEEEHIQDGAVVTAAIANSNVTLAKLANIADDRVLGNISGSAAAPAELTAANLRTLLTVADGSLSQNNFTNADHTKLNGIAASANNYVHPNHSGEVTSNADGATTIANGAVVADRIAADAVITAKILNANVTTAKIAADAVTSAKIADDAVDTEHIADDAIEEEHIGDGEVKTAAIGDEQVTLAKMANMATSRVLGRISSNAGVPEVLTAANIRTILGVADGSLTTNDFTNADHTKLNGIEASATIDQTASEILTLIEDGVDSVHYKDASIDAAHLAADAVTTAKIADDAVTADKLAADAVVNASVAAGAAITFAKLEPLDSTKILVGSGSNVATEVAISGDVTMANDGAVTIGNDKIDSQHYAAASIDNEHLADNAVDTDEIAADAVTSAKIADDAIEEEHIGDGEVKTAAIANSNVTLAKIANIADDTVLGNIAGSAAAPTALTVAQLRTLLNIPVVEIMKYNKTGTGNPASNLTYDNNSNQTFLIAIGSNQWAEDTQGTTHTSMEITDDYGIKFNQTGIYQICSSFNFHSTSAYSGGTVCQVYVSTTQPDQSNTGWAPSSIAINMGYNRFDVNLSNQALSLDPDFTQVFNITSADTTVWFYANIQGGVSDFHIRGHSSARVTDVAVTRIGNVQT